MTIKDIYNYVKADFCGDCIKYRDNGYICPIDLGMGYVYCGIDSVLISLEYLARGEYYG